LKQVLLLGFDRQRWERRKAELRAKIKTGIEPDWKLTHSHGFFDQLSLCLVPETAQEKTAGNVSSVTVQKYIAEQKSR
jgi:hypothetical protein